MPTCREVRMWYPGVGYWYTRRPRASISLPAHGSLAEPHTTDRTAGLHIPHPLPGSPWPLPCRVGQGLVRSGRWAPHSLGRFALAVLYPGYLFGYRYPTLHIARSSHNASQRQTPYRRSCSIPILWPACRDLSQASPPQSAIGRLAFRRGHA